MNHTIKGGLMVAALLVSSTAVQGQGSHIPATLAGVTVAGTFTPSSRNISKVSASDGSRTVNLPATLRNIKVQPPEGTPPSIYEMVAGSEFAAAGKASMTSALTRANVGPQSEALANALAQLAGPTVASVVTAINAWNAAVRNMSGPQLRALLSTPEGVAAVRVMRLAAADLVARRSTT